MSKTINDLPNEMLLKIFSFCTAEDLVLSIQYVNRRWGELSQDSKIWKQLTFFPKRSASIGHIIKVLKSSPQLRSFILMQNVCKLVTTVICKYCPLIENLEFYDVLPVSVVMMKKILKYLPNLKTLTLGSMNVDSQKLANVLGKYNTLKKLSLMNTYFIGNDLLKSVANGCKSLEYLRLDGVDVNNSVIKYLITVKGPQLKRLYLDCFRLSSASLKSIKVCTNLEAFMFHNCTSMTEGIFLDVVSLPKLKVLRLPEARQISPDTLIAGLRRMNLAELTDLDLSKSFLDDRGAKCLSENCQKLKYLNVSSCVCLTDLALKYISRCSSLEHLNVDNCGFTDAGMQFLPNLVHLRYLNISNTKITDFGMHFVSKCLRLRGLQINFCNVSAASVGVILATVNLTRFSCFGCKMIFANRSYSYEGRRLHFDQNYSNLIDYTLMMN